MFAGERQEPVVDRQQGIGLPELGARQVQRVEGLEADSDQVVGAGGQAFLRQLQERLPSDPRLDPRRPPSDGVQAVLERVRPRANELDLVRGCSEDRQTASLSRRIRSWVWSSKGRFRQQMSR